MKTVEQITKERNDLINDRPNMGTRERKRAGKRVTFLKDALVYLESSPREDFVLKSIDRLTKQKKKIDEGFGVWSGHDEHKGKSTTSLRSMYRTEMGWKKIKSQIDALNYILS